MTVEQIKEITCGAQVALADGTVGILLGWVGITECVVLDVVADGTIRHVPWSQLSRDGSGRLVMSERQLHASP